MNASELSGNLANLASKKIMDNLDNILEGKENLRFKQFRSNACKED